MLYQSLSVASPTVTFSVFASGGSQLEFPDGDTPGNWLTISPATEQDLSQSDYTLTLNTASADFPDPFPLAGKTINVVNKGDETKKTTFKLKLKSDITVTSAITGNAEFDAGKGILRLYNNPNDKITLNVKVIGGVELDVTANWLTVDKTITDKNMNTYVFSVGAGASTGVSQKLTFRSKADNSITKVYTVYSIKKELVFSNYTDNSSYSYIDNLSDTNPAITYFPCDGSYCEFTVVSPKGINISASSAWASVTEYSSDKNSATGVVTSKVRVRRTQSDSYYGDFNQTNFAATVSNGYFNLSSDKKTFTVKQYTGGIVYPKSNVPANKVSGYNDYWVAGENGYQNGRGTVSYSNLLTMINNSTACPPGWRVPVLSDFSNMTRIDGLNNNGHINEIHYWSSYTQLKTAFNGNYYWTKDGDGRGFLTNNDGFGLWDFGKGNGSVTYRCIK